MAINISEKLVFQCPCHDGSVTKRYFYHGPNNMHLGVDFGWTEYAYRYNCDVQAIQDGIVVDNFYSSSCGNSIVLQHNYTDGTHRFSGYIHLRNRSQYKIGSSVKQGESIGIKGNTGYSNGEHLHIYVSNTTTRAYDWSFMKSLCNFDPEQYFYKDKNINYTGEWYKDRKILQDYKIQYPEPVPRDTSRKQVEVLIDYLYLRDAPNGNAYADFCKIGIFNVLDEQVSGSYNWYKIADGFWIASGGTRTKDLLAEKSEVEQLKDRINELEKQLVEVQDKLNKSISLSESYETRLDKIKDIIES